MKVIGLRIPLLYRLFLFVALATSWFSGAGFFLMDRFFQIEGEFGLEKHPWQNPALTIHGAAAFVMLIAFGALLSAHVPMGWRTHRSRFWGLTLVSLLAVQALSAYCLYYLSEEVARDLVAWVHLGVGLCLPLVLAGHILAGRKSRKSQKTQRGQTHPYN